MSTLLLTVILAQSLAANPPTVGVIADDLVDYSQWVAPQKALWTGAEVARLLSEAGMKPTLLKREDLTLEAFSRFDALLIATDHTYPERGKWGGPVAKALVECVRQGGVYVMPIGIPHWSSKDLDTGKLEAGHWEDIFGFRGDASVSGRGPLQLTRQGRAVGLPEPTAVNARPARLMNYPESAVLVWSTDYVPCMSAVPFGKGWLIHWGAGPEGGMDRSVRDFLIPAYAKAITAAREGKLKAMSRQTLMKEEDLAGKSLDDVDRDAFKPGPGPFDTQPITVELDEATSESDDVIAESWSKSLDGTWEMLGLPKGTGDARELTRALSWKDAVLARVPGSVQASLFEAGRIPDPTVGLNDVQARVEVAEKEWWFRRQFDSSAGSWDLVQVAREGGRARLVFDGVDYSATFWLNGERLGEHEGPFGGPTFDITSLIREHNTLVVRVDPLPPDWKLVFKTNCVYGWHYVNCPPIGIWQSVRVEAVGPAEITEMFVAATDSQSGKVDVHVVIEGPQQENCACFGRLSPANFKGKSYALQAPSPSVGNRSVMHLQFDIPEPRLWWPVDLGEQNLYTLEMAVSGGHYPWSVRRTRFGVRTIKMGPTPDGPLPDRHNWTFVINGRPTFLKGCNWATTDAFLRLTPDRYRRFLTLARDEHIQIMRSWGGGLLETDIFYDLCDELGIMVMQEFPLTWQEFDKIRLSVADEIAVHNVQRLRNHPSLAMWCGGNEHHGGGWLIELLGRRCLELDGTRPYHRTDPYGGSIHDYGVYWGKLPFEHYMTLVPQPGKPGPIAIGETGLASACSLEGTLRYLPKEEQNVWPPPPKGAFIHHTPTFTPENMDFLNRHAKELDRCKDLAGFVRGTQLAQALGLRTVLERMRCRWPESTAMIFYKLTDVFPGCSWSTVDYYGIPKIAHYFVRSAFGPLHACALYESLDVEPGKELAVRIMVLDDMERLSSPAVVSVRLFDAKLREVAGRRLEVSGPAGRVRDLGEVKMAAPSVDAAPLLLLVELRRKDQPDGQPLDRTFYWFNFRGRPGCLFDLPKTRMKTQKRTDKSVDQVSVTNEGNLPAVAVNVVAPDCSDSLRLIDNYFWLEPGESRSVSVFLMHSAEGQEHKPKEIGVAAWNAEPQTVQW